MPVGTTNRDKVKDSAAQERENRGSGATFFKLKDGKNKVRILPPPPGDYDLPFFKTATCWGVGPNKTNVNVPLDAKSRPTGWLVEKIHELSQSKRSDDKKYAEAIRPKKQWLYNIIDLNDLEAGIQVMPVGIKVHEQILAYVEDDDPDDGYGDITDLNEGYDLTITRSGAGRSTEYKVKAAKKASSIPDEIVELLETESPADLTSVRPVANDDEQKLAFFGEEAGAEDEDDDEEEETPVVRRTSRRAAPVEEDDDEDEEDEKPAPRKAAPAASDDDDDEDEESDDEEDEKPATTRRNFASRMRSRRK